MIEEATEYAEQEVEGSPGHLQELARIDTLDDLLVYIEDNV